MAFTQAWDETYPSDTITANNYGDALRDLRRDTRERRVAFGAGRIADRENPESVFGTANTGVLYFSMDEKKIYRWNSTSWVDITSLFLPNYIRNYGNTIYVTFYSGFPIGYGPQVSVESLAFKVGSIIEFDSVITGAYGSPNSATIAMLINGKTIASDGGANGGMLRFSGAAVVTALGATTTLVCTTRKFMTSNGTDAFVKVENNTVVVTTAADGTLTLGTYQSNLGDSSGDTHQFCRIIVRE